MKEVVCWTDGSCYNNGDRVGGWAYLIKVNDEIIQEEAACKLNTSSNYMEMTAAIKAAEACKELGLRDIEIRSDSSYLVNCFRQKWWYKWRAHGWINSQGKDVANRELWEELIYLWDEVGITFIHVKGHIGTEENERVDFLAGEARKRKGKVKISY